MQQAQAPQQVQQVLGGGGAQRQRLRDVRGAGRRDQVREQVQFQGGVERGGFDRRGGQVPIALQGQGEVGMAGSLC
ncbi:hypothetical protein WJ971_19345 [Achromobacter xylosoxidans]